MEEIWKEIDGYPNYMISSKGRVKSLERYDKLGRLVKEKILKQGAEVQRQMGIPNQNVTSCCRGEYKTTHGYIFSYQSL